MTFLDLTGYPEPLASCRDCARHYVAHTYLLKGAFASVGIEHGMSAWEMAEAYYQQRHESEGHE